MIQLSQFAEDIIFYVENPKASTKEMLKIKNKNKLKTKKFLAQMWKIETLV